MVIHMIENVQIQKNEKVKLNTTYFNELMQKEKLNGLTLSKKANLHFNTISQARNGYYIKLSTYLKLMQSLGLSDTDYLLASNKFRDIANTYLNERSGDAEKVVK